MQVWLIKFCFASIWFKIPHTTVSYLLHMSQHMFAARFYPHTAVSRILFFSPIGGSFCHGLALKATHTTLQMLNPCGSFQAQNKSLYMLWFEVSCMFLSVKAMGGGNPHHPKKLFLLHYHVWMHFYRLKIVSELIKRCIIYTFPQTNLQLMGGAENTTCQKKDYGHMETTYFFSCFCMDWVKKLL